MTSNFVPERRSPRPLRSVLRRLVPRDRRFYALFDRHAELCVEGVTALAQLLSEVRDPNGRVREIEAIEKRADTVVDDTLALDPALTAAAVSARAIHALINRLDDILDLTEDVAQSLHLYHVTTLTPDAHRLAALAVRGADKLRLAVGQLQSVDDPRAILALCQEVDEFEAQADHVMRAAMSKLFREEPDTRQLVKLRAIYELLEQLTDACKHAAAEVQALARTLAMTTTLWIVAVLLIVVGVAGTVLPALPGVPLIFGGVLLAAWIGDFQRISVFTVVVMAILAVLGIVIDYVAAAVSAKRAGASKEGIIGAAIGTLAGVFTGLWGLLFMPLVGAAVGEFIAHKDMFRAGKVGAATWFGLLVATAVKLAIAFTMVGVFIAALVI